MSQKLMTKKSLVQWCDEQVAQGKEIGIGWEGGGDSGWCYFMIDGSQVNNTEYTTEMEQLIDMMDDELDYGSWAGEFSANGEAIYSPEKKAFVGIDYYSEDETIQRNCDIPIRIPKHLWFDSIEYNIQDEEANTEFAFVIRNGFLTEEHEALTSHLEQYLQTRVQEEIDSFIHDSHREYRSMWQNDRINRNDFEEQGDDLVYVIGELGIGTMDSSDKDVYLELTTEEDEA